METGRTWILWRYVANKGDVVGFDHFSASAPYKILHKKLG
jgi:transketolase